MVSFESLSLVSKHSQLRRASSDAASSILRDDSLFAARIEPLTKIANPVVHITDLNGVDFSLVRQTGTAFSEFMPGIIGKAEIGADNFAKLEAGFDRMLDFMRKADGSRSPRQTMKEAHDVFTDEMLPVFNSARVRVWVHESGGNGIYSFSHNYAPSLNPAYQLANGKVLDLNRRSHMQLFMKNAGTDSPLGDTLSFRLDNSLGKGYASPDDPAMIVDYLRSNLYSLAGEHPELKQIWDPLALQAHENGGRHVIPMTYSLIVPNAFRYGKTAADLKESAFTISEEVFHLKQALSGTRYLTQMGPSLHKLYDEPPISLRQIAQKYEHEGGAARFARENELLAVWRNLGLNPPESFLARYERNYPAVRSLLGTN